MIISQLEVECDVANVAAFYAHTAVLPMGRNSHVWLIPISSVGCLLRNFLYQIFVGTKISDILTRVNSDLFVIPSHVKVPHLQSTQLNKLTHSICLLDVPISDDSPLMSTQMRMWRQFHCGRNYSHSHSNERCHLFFFTRRFECACVYDFLMSSC